MARGFLNHVWYKLLDEEGVPISGATVYLYEYANSVTTKLKVLNSLGVSASNPKYTDEQGIFEFYVKDHIKANAEGGYGYKWDKRYIISWSKDDKSGITVGDYLFGLFRSVEVSGSSTRLNRAMSNYLGWMFEDHANFVFGTTNRCGSSSSSSVSFSSTSSSSSSTISSRTPVDPWDQYTNVMSSLYLYPYDSIGSGAGYWTINNWYLGIRPTQMQVIGTPSDTTSVLEVYSLDNQNYQLLGSSSISQDGTTVVDLTYPGSEEEYDIREFYLNGYSSVTSVKFSSTLNTRTEYAPLEFGEYNASDVVVSPDGQLAAKLTTDGFDIAYTTETFSTGKLYFEFTPIQADSTCSYGFVEASYPYAENIGESSSDFGIGVTIGTEEYKYNGSDYSLSGIGSWASYDVMMIAVDITNDKIWYGKNGVWFNSGDPVNGTNPTIDITSLFDGKSVALGISMRAISDQGFIETTRDWFYYNVPDGFTPPSEV